VTDAVIVTHGLTKHFGRVVAVDGIDLDVREGDRFGFLGPNGSGKTTTVRMLLGLVFATQGTAEVMGQPVPRRTGRALADVGSLVEGPAAYSHLSGRANLRLLDASGGGGARRSRRTRVDEAMESVGLAGVGRRPVKAYSLGMRQRLGLAAALMRRPRLLVLDEPTNGLDPQGIHEIRELLLALNRDGTTVFLSSHLLHEVEELCTRVAVVDRGRLVLQDDLAALRAPTGRVAVSTPDVDTAVGVLDGHVVSRAGDRLLVRGLPPEVLTARLVAAGARVHEMAPERRSLEQVVLDVTSHGSDRVAGGVVDGPLHRKGRAP
jgi:ABC-type multidrug transport system ATPase subunit